MSEDFNERLRSIEELLAFQESTIEDLSDVIIAQEKQINTLQEEVEKMQSALKALSHKGKVPNPPPPHY